MCPSTEQLQSYYDHELPETVRVQVEAHLETCASCRLQLQQFASLSALLSGTEFPKLLPMSRARLHQRLRRTMDRGLLRLAWSLSGVAAAVLVAGTLWLNTAAKPVQVAPPWVEAMAATHSLSRESASPAAEWYLADASLRSDEQP